MQDPTVTKARKNRVIIILGFCAVLFVQGIVSFVVVPEPYPTIRMPAFVSGPTPDGLFKKTIATVEITYTDGSTVSPHPVELMEGFRFSAARASMDYMFSPEGKGEVTPEVEDWLRDRAEDLGGGKTPESVSFCWQKAFVDVRDAEYVKAQPCTTARIDL